MKIKKKKKAEKLSKSLKRNNPTLINKTNLLNPKQNKGGENKKKF